MGDDGRRMILAILVITLLAPGLAFLIFVVFQGLLLGKADPPGDEVGAPPRDPDDTTEHDENAES